MYTIFSINVIVSFVTVFASVLFVHQPGANHAPGASVTQVNHSVRTLSTFIIIIIIIIIDADVSLAVTSTRTKSILKQNNINHQIRYKKETS